LAFILAAIGQCRHPQKPEIWQDALVRAHHERQPLRLLEVVIHAIGSVFIQIVYDVATGATPRELDINAEYGRQVPKLTAAQRVDGRKSAATIAPKAANIHPANKVRPIKPSVFCQPK
jgi:hypothetical protein